MADLPEFLNWIETSTEQVIPSTFNVKKLRRQSIPNTVMINGKKKNVKITPLTTWIKYRKHQAIPESFKYDKFQYKGYIQGCTPLFYWIRYRQNEPVPADLLYDDFVRDCDIYGHTLIHNWIRYRHDEPIPECFKFNGWQRYGGRACVTPIIAWISYTKKPIPQELIYDYFYTWRGVAEIKLVNSIPCRVATNPILLWIINRPGQPVPDLLLSDYISGYSGTQLGDIIVVWILVNKSLPPENLRYPKWNQSRDSIRDTPLMAWIYASGPDCAEIPEELLYRNVQQAKNICNLTALILWLYNKSPHIVIPKQITRKQNTPYLIETWRKYRPDQPLPDYFQLPQIAQDIHQCCICYNENITTYYTCEHQHPDAAICIDCYARLAQTSKRCPICRAKLL